MKEFLRKMLKYARLQSCLRVTALAGAVFLLAACGSLQGGVGKQTQAAVYPMTRDLFLLDTFCTITVYEGGGQQALDAAADRLTRLDELLDFNKEGSDLYRINHRESEWVEISPETARMLELGREMCTESGGALEPAIRPVTSLWDFKEVKKVPQDEDIREALSRVKSQAWEIRDGKFHALDPAVQLDAGAFAKGFVADELKAGLAADGVTSALINLGGNVLCLGAKPDGSPFKIAIRDPSPDNAEHYRKEDVMELTDISAVTAGIYERCFEENGVLYHHIMDPSTGYPVQNGLLSVTVTGNSSAICDALCTAVFVLGPEKGSAFLERYNEEHESSYTARFLEKE